MLSGSLFSHNQGRFQPRNHFINDDGSMSSTSTSVIKTKTRDHLAVDVDPRTPTLRRYTKFNMSTNNFTSQRQFRARDDNHRSDLPLIKIEQFDDQCRNNSWSDRHRQPRQLSPTKKVDVSTNHINSDAKNWLLMDKGVELRSASVNRGGGATSFSWLWLDDHSKKKPKQVKNDKDSAASSLKNKHLTLGNLNLFKSDVNGSKLGQSVDCDHRCCQCSSKAGQTYSKTLPSSVKQRPTILPQSEMIDDKITSGIRNDPSEHLPRSPTSTSSSSKSSQNSTDASGKCHLSCPDLLQPCLNREASSDSLLGSTLSRNRTKKKNEKKSWKNKQLECWNLDDVLLWLQSIGLEDVTSLLIGQ